MHNSADLKAQNGMKLIQWMESLRERHIVEKIGISIYESTELKGLPLERIQIVQVPLSIYDQRMYMDGTIRRLREKVYT